ISLTEEEKTEVQLQAATTSQIIKKDYETIIDETAKKYYPQVKDYIANEQEFQKIIKGIITIESQGSWNAIGVSGEVGLMQIMPQVSIELGLKTYDPNDKIKNAQDKWSNEILNYLKTDYVTELKNLKNTKTKAELIAIDERFDETKNIDAGTKHLASLIVQFKDWELGVMAYNAGATGVKEKCVPLVITACDTKFESFKYLQRVKATIA
ncbi:MAG: lytic transglycosylase domain-containing protein, partial [Candidatus Nanoarchaeia archaeon]